MLYYWRHARKYPRQLLGIGISIPIVYLANTFLPILVVSDIFNKLASHHYTPHKVWASFGPELVLFGVLMLGGMLCWRLVDLFAFKLERLVQTDIAEEVFGHMIKQTADFHANNFTGSLVSQNSKLLGGYIRTADTIIYQTYPLLCSLIFSVTILAPKSWLAALLLAVFSAAYILASLKISRPVRKLAGKHAAAESKQTGALADALTNSMAIKSFATGHYERERFHAATQVTERHFRLFSRAWHYQMFSLGFANRIISSMALVMAVVGILVFGVPLGTAYLILSYSSSVVDQLFQFANNSLRNFSRSFGDASDMVKILAEAPTVTDPKRPEKSRIGKGKIDFQHVTFTHDGSDDSIFRDLQLSIKAGEKFGLVGHSGSGKTTFTRLLMRFSDIDSGTIAIDGQNIAKITQDDLHRAIAYVPQEPLLFHRSIRENIGYGQPDAGDKDIEQAAKLAHAAEFIDHLPEHYETLVGERGVKLSGGQRQRIAIARAMLKDAPILLLDEATSALDSESEILIQDALWKLMEGRTAIVIAHRLSTIQKMDRIIVLDNGQIIEQGTHRQLLKSGGSYAKLWQHQSGGFIEE